MRHAWEVVLHEDAVSFLLSCRSVERNKVLRFIEHLVNRQRYRGTSRNVMTLDTCCRSGCMAIIW